MKKKMKSKIADRIMRQWLAVNKELWTLINKGTITHTLMTHQDLEEGELVVYTPGQEDEARHYEVTHIFAAGNGYLAQGYPESWRVRGSAGACKVLRVVPSNAEGDE